jgi:hypothetical protein
VVCLLLFSGNADSFTITTVAETDVNYGISFFFKQKRESIISFRGVHFYIKGLENKRNNKLILNFQTEDPNKNRNTNLV